MTVPAAETPPRPKLVTIPRIPIAAVGKWDCMTGKTEFTRSMMESMVAASRDPGIGLPKIKRGHSSTDADPLLGLAANLEIDDDGVVYADFAGIDADEADALPFRYPDRSIEARRNVTSPITGKTYEFVAPYLAMLPIDGAVDILIDMPLPSHMQEAELVAASKHFDVLASWDPDVVRREWDAQMNGGGDPAPGKRYTYVEQIELEPNAVIVSDGSDTYRIAFSISESSDVTFDTDAKASVVRAYVPTPSSPEEKVAASHAPRVAKVYASGRLTGQNPTPTEKEKSMDFTKLKTLFGMPEDATEEQVRAKAAEHNMALVEDSGDPEPKDDDKPEPKDDPKPEGFKVPEGMVLMDEAMATSLNEGIQVAASLRKEKDEETRESFLNGAVLAGKFPPARVTHYRNLWGADPEGTRDLIDTLASGVVPVTAESGIMAGKSAVGAEAQVDAIAASFGVANIVEKGA